jgi:hypothetical protein
MGADPAPAGQAQGAGSRPSSEGGARRSVQGREGSGISHEVVALHLARGAGCREQGVQREGMDLKSVDLDRALTDDEVATAQTQMVEAPLCLASFLHSRGRRVQLGEPGHVRGECIGRRVHGACACEPFVDADPKISSPIFFVLTTAPTYSFKTF